MSKKIKILLLSDDLRVSSGVGTVARDLVIGTSHIYDWVNLGAAIGHKEVGKIIDLSQSVNDLKGITNANVKIYPNEGYGNPEIVRTLIKRESPDVIMIFTDPRYWTWLFTMERELRSKMPLVYLNIWDSLPAPHYNRDYYNSCDALFAISQQTLALNKLVLGEDISKTKTLKYIPHGINPDLFYPITESSRDYQQYLDFKKKVLPEGTEFVAFWNSRNITRKHPSDVIYAFSEFCRKLPVDLAKKCALVMHTDPIDKHGTNLLEVAKLYANSNTNIVFSEHKLDVQHMNYLYNMAAVTLLISSNEGWGLSVTESLMTGTPVIANVTGGIQDQLRFKTNTGERLQLDENFPSNHRGDFRKCGEWAFPVYPASISLQGSIPTPYIFDDRCEPLDVTKALEDVYNLTPEERTERGLKGREWVLSEESGMSTPEMCKKFEKGIQEVLTTWTPRSSYELLKI